MSNSALITAIILIGVGFLLCFFGKKVRSVFIFITGGFMGVTLFSIILSALDTTESFSLDKFLIDLAEAIKFIPKDILPVVLSILIFLLFGLVSLMFARLFIALFVGYWGFVLFNLLANMLGFNNGVLVLIFSVIGGIIGFILAFKFELIMVSIATSFSGAILITFGIDFFRGIQRFAVPVRSVETIEEAQTVISQNFINEFVKAFGNLDVVSILLIVFISILGVMFQNKFNMHK